MYFMTMEHVNKFAHNPKTKLLILPKLETYTVIGYYIYITKCVYTVIVMNTITRLVP